MVNMQISQLLPQLLGKTFIIIKPNKIESKTQLPKGRKNKEIKPD